jgi:hypothetical protein
MDDEARSFLDNELSIISSFCFVTHSEHLPRPALCYKLTDCGTAGTVLAVYFQRTLDEERRRKAYVSLSDLEQKEAADHFEDINELV